MMHDTKLTKAQQELVDVTDGMIFATYFTVAGAFLSLIFLAGGSWLSYTASALLLVFSLLSAIQLLRLWKRQSELHSRGVKEPHVGKPAYLEGIERMMHPSEE